jgi:hypothetical protein
MVQVKDVGVHSPVPDRRPARESNVTSTANCIRSADRTERAEPATAHGAVAVMTMHLTTT